MRLLTQDESVKGEARDPLMDLLEKLHPVSYGEGAHSEEIFETYVEFRSN
jgi:hypothetical protein